MTANKPMPWDESRLSAVRLEAANCPDACAADVASLVAEVRRLRVLLTRNHSGYTRCLAYGCTWHTEDPPFHVAECPLA